VAPKRFWLGLAVFCKQINEPPHMAAMVQYIVPYRGVNATSLQPVQQKMAVPCGAAIF